MQTKHSLTFSLLWLDLISLTHFVSVMSHHAWRCLELVQMWQLGTGFSGGLACAGSWVEQTQWFCCSVIPSIKYLVKVKNIVCWSVNKKLWGKGWQYLKMDLENHEFKWVLFVTNMCLEGVKFKNTTEYSIWTCFLPHLRS